MLKKIHITFLLVVLLIPISGTAQHYNVWKTSGMTLDFNTEPPTFSVDKKAAFGRHSSICDEKGELMFYIGGFPSSYIYNISNAKDDEILPSDSAWIHGYTDRFRSALFWANDSLAYLFYPASPGNRNGPGLFYTAINKNMNTGKGGIVPFQKDVRIYPTHCAGLTATMNDDGSWWIATRSYDSLLAFKLDKTGISGPISTYAPDNRHPEKYVIPLMNPQILCMRFSHDGKKLVSLSDYAFAMGKIGHNLAQSNFYFYSFNKTTGKFTNQQIIEQSIEVPGSGNPVKSYWDAVFSPNDSLLYLLVFNGADCYIDQYERFTADLKASKECIHYRAEQTSENNVGLHALELGQNGRIYLGNGSVIYRPNKKGRDCMLKASGGYKMMPCDFFPSGNCLQETYPFSRYHGLYMNFTPVVQCDSSIKLLNLCDKSKFASYRWYIYDTDSTSGYVDSSYAEEAVFKTPRAGRYWVKLRAITPKGYGPWYSDTIEFANPVFPVADFSVEDTFACRYVKYRLSNKSILNQSNPNLAPTWHWYFGDGKDTVVGGSGDIEYAYTQTGTFAVKLVVNNGYCSDSMIKQNLVSIIDAPQPGITVNQSTGCQPLELKIQRTYKDTILQAQYDFGDGSAVFDATVVNLTEANAQKTYPLPGVYPLAQVLYGPSGCVTTDTLEINVLQGFDSLASSELFVVTVAEDTAIFIQWDATTHAKNYRLLRLENGTNAQQIALTKDLQYTDLSAQLNKTFYTYQIEALDTCLVAVSSNIGTSILLEGENKNNEYSLLQWNDYQQWQNGILHYEIEIKDDFGNWTSLNNTQQSDYQDMQYLQECGLEKCYRIKAFENGGNNAVSFSNSLCLPYMPILWIPNAFSPTGDGLNDKFTISNYGIKELELNIYNLYGELIFQGKGTDSAWDGTYKGKPCSIGAYAYTIKAKPQSGRNIIEKGTVTLVR